MHANWMEIEKKALEVADDATDDVEECMARAVYNAALAYRMSQQEPTP